jgi:choline dehydrogenase-like flavoprotein
MTESRLVDFVVVGAGLTGVQAAQTLLEGGASVLLLDGGATANPSLEPPVERNFLSLRTGDDAQYRYFLGEHMEAVSTPAGRPGSQLTPTRKFVMEGVGRWLRFRSDSFTPMESLAQGGLGNAWGVGCYHFSDRDLESAGLPATEIRDAYQVVSDRLGVQGADDDTRVFCAGDVKNLQPVMDMDAAAGDLYARYRRRRDALVRQGMYVGRPALAVLTQPKDGRRPINYDNMDFYSDQRETAYRPWITLKALTRNPRFEYRGGIVVTAFAEDGDGVTVSGFIMNRDERTAVSVRARKLVLCAGAIGSMRVVARSLNGLGRPFPILCNPCDYLLGVQRSRIGKPLGERTASFAQLAVFYRPPGDDAVVYSGGSIYSYQSLMLFRLAREAPLAFALSRDILQYMQTSLLMIGMTYPDWPAPENYLKLVPDPDSPTGDVLTAEYDMSSRQVMMRSKTLGAIRRTFPSMGCWIASSVRGQNGFSSHYAGTIPYASDERPFSLASDGRVHGTRAVYVADGSGLRFLPALGLSWTIMANAHRVAHRLARV